MTDPTLPKSVRHRRASPGSSADGSAPASARQVARLRFLEVPFREPLSISQAGTLIDRTNADPEFAARIEEWHTRKFILHPVLYPDASPAAVVPDRQISGKEFHLPPRGEQETNATIFQKRRLELFGGCDLPVLDSLGRDQAAALIVFLEAQSVARSLEKLRADGALRHAETESTETAAPAPQAGAPLLVAAPPPSRRSVSAWKILGGVVGLLGLGLGALVFFGTSAPLALQDSTEAKSASGLPVAPPAASSPGKAAVSFAQTVAASQARAVKKYPALGVAGSPFNKAFVARYQQLNKQQAAQLKSPDWPEKLADECALKTPGR